MAQSRPGIDDTYRAVPEAENRTEHYLNSLDADPTATPPRPCPKLPPSPARTPDPAQPTPSPERSSSFAPSYRRPLAALMRDRGRTDPRMRHITVAHCRPERAPGPHGHRRGQLHPARPSASTAATRRPRGLPLHGAPARRPVSAEIPLADVRRSALDFLSANGARLDGVRWQEPSWFRVFRPSPSASPEPEPKALSGLASVDIPRPPHPVGTGTGEDSAVRLAGAADLRRGRGPDPPGPLGWVRSPLAVGGRRRASTARGRHPVRS
ncbi:hypothetical protein LX15_005338 [Streptoalloteichus tenebrarius]|uniref:Uncharacterized protein n=1 Tax=Streptoalloteichus tenebrarius (strain ATCC 17920 / DSM 40477 / JCM 4838 / CBS 697.72 / NBRC 16177 / NCIMB 11028 / NRRL B-12390 / A12253. 1 / ISP 5477) TaxID=1933 RepID=A0ABT1I1E1_STRSD|nr:hypothetical protein [Streptoalloteichus tenebrarius]